MNVAPCGSLMIVIRTRGASKGGTIPCAPSSVAFAAVASAAASAKITLQCAGASGWSSAIGLIVATTSSNPAGATAALANDAPTVPLPATPASRQADQTPV